MTTSPSPNPIAMQSTGGLSERRVINYTARYMGIPFEAVTLDALTPDASTRKYYRVADVARPAQTCIISLYPAPFAPQDNSYLDVTRLFEQAALPVPKVIDVAGEEGIILQEDLGDTSLAKWLAEANDHAADEMLNRAIELIARIQAVTPLAYDMNSVSSRLAFDEDKLAWELNYFFAHYFGSYRQQVLSEEEAAAIKRDLQTIAAELAARPRVLTHRDYHAMNLMVDARGELRIRCGHCLHRHPALRPSSRRSAATPRRGPPSALRTAPSPRRGTLPGSRRSSLPPNPRGETCTPSPWSCRTGP